MKIHSNFIFAVILICCSCARIQGPADATVPYDEKKGNETYLRIQNKLENSGDTLDYDTLMEVYSSIIQSPYEIPHIDQLLNSLIYKRNENPRIDQMILILSARAIRSSKYPVPNVYHIFESILKMDDRRINEWVITFVAGAVGDYAFEIPDGDRLADMLDEWVDRIRSLPVGANEDFGFHFLSPPRSNFIRSYIAGIEEQRKREVERRCYYLLIRNNIAEIEIEAVLKHLQAHGIPGTGEKCLRPMKYMFQNKDKVFHDLKAEKNQMKLPRNNENKWQREQKK